MLVSVMDGDLVDHDARLEGRASEHLLDHDDHVQAIAATFLVVVEMLLGSGSLPILCKGFYLLHSNFTSHG